MTDSIVARMDKMFRVSKDVADRVGIASEKIGDSYVLYESRPVWGDNLKPWTKSEVAKITFVKRRKIWKLFWKRASGKWEPYGEYKSINNALNIVNKDTDGCFWG